MGKLRLVCPGPSFRPYRRPICGDRLRLRGSNEGTLLDAAGLLADGLLVNPRSGPAPAGGRAHSDDVSGTAAGGRSNRSSRGRAGRRVPRDAAKTPTRSCYPLVRGRLAAGDSVLRLVVLRGAAGLRQLSLGLQRFWPFRLAGCQHLGGPRLSAGDAELAGVLGSLQSRPGLARAAVGNVARSAIVPLDSSDLSGGAVAGGLWHRAAVGGKLGRGRRLGRRLLGVSRRGPAQPELLLRLASGELGLAADLLGRLGPALQSADSGVSCGTSRL